MAVLPLIALGSPRPGAYSAATFPTGATPTRNAADAFASWLTPLTPDVPVNLLPSDDATFEATAGSWVVNGNTTSVARSTTSPREGAACLAVLAAGTGNSGIRTANGTSAIPVVAGQRYTFLVSAQGNKATAGLFMEVAFWDSGGAGLGSQNNAWAATIKNTGYSDHALEVVAPAGAAYAGLLLQHGDSPTATDWRIDRAGLFAGSVRSIRWTAPAGGGGNSQALTAATETDAGVALPHETTRDLAPAAETDSVPTLARTRTRALTPAGETDAAVGVTRTRTRAMVPAVEADAAPGVTRTRTRPLVPATEADAGLGLARTRTQALAPAVEADTALPLPRAGHALAPATETDTATTLARTRTRALAPAVETDAVAPMPQARTRPLAPATETGTALTLAHVRARTLAVAAETDAAVALTGGRTHLLAPVVEDDLAAAVAHTRMRILGPAGEADSAVALTVPTKPGTITPRPVASPAITPAAVGSPAITPRTVAGTTLTTVDAAGATITPRPDTGATIRPA